MQILDILTILCVGFMIGNELTVSLFINPVVRQLDEGTQAKILRLFAALLGKAMPVWYGISLLLMLIEAYARRHEPALSSLLIASAVWIAVIVFSIAALVPINDRIATLKDGSLPEGWQQQPKKWETLHRWRILSITAAMIFLLHGILR
ncbi:DUF1772 domain-containing protein [Acidobacterium sp. S8]|uniref:DUF1772 domain-containing protein n=1 Tax=Acidobacterium sp. S8 TaxID=1641854 RepID=UPI00131C4A69|nr:DUF1772 domain-containing protein [Acidobacterium sp. S8]